jgi:site-specific recombinase
MRAVRKLRRVFRRRAAVASTFSRPIESLYALTEAFCEAATLSAQVRRARLLFAAIWVGASERQFVVQLLRWVRLLEQDEELRERFQATWGNMLSEMDAVSLLAETGLPGQQGLLGEVIRRMVQRVLPSAREETDARRLLGELFSNTRTAQRFLRQPRFVLERLLRLCWPLPGSAAERRLKDDLRQAMCLLAARVSGKGAGASVRQRGTARAVEASPFYRLVFATESLMRAHTPMERAIQQDLWMNHIADCGEEMEEIHLHMEDAGVSSALVYDLRSMEASLERMQLLAPLLLHEARGAAAEVERLPERRLVETVLRGRLNDTRLRALVHQNLNLLARKTVERTGQGGEHYIAHTRADYWTMGRAGIGGGLLTVFTAAIKMRLIEAHLPLAIEGLGIGTDYAVSFILLQVFGFALATKQPSMTAAALAGIVRENRGVTRWSKISEFAADISRTQLAAAFSNVIAVCLGAVAFERVWRHLFKTHYLPVESAQHVYQTLHPFTSGTAIFAAATGLLLWLAAVIGGWVENFAVYHRIPEAIAQHPAGTRMGGRTMRRVSDWLEKNVASWSTSIVLGYLLGLTPVIARFFGIPFDVRHVTLSTGTLALAAARFGTSSFGHGWLYAAIAGIGITFVLNLGVSFAIASVVALRAYDVPWEEQVQILRFLLREVFSSPLSFILPLKEDMPSITPVLRGRRE